MKFTGERYVPELDAPEISYEHWHRYLFATPLVKDKVVLDIASGEGYGSSLLARTAKQVTGVDADPEAVMHAANSYRMANLEFRQGTVDAIPIAGQEIFDVVVSFETIEHVGEVEQLAFAREVKRLLKPGGVLLISTPDRLIYSDRPAYRNQFHKREFYRKEFLDFLGGFFRNVRLFGQHVYPVSYIWPLEKAQNAGSEYQLAHSDGKFVPATDDLKEGVYLVALCSDGNLDGVGPSVLLDLFNRYAQAQSEASRLKDEELRSTLEAQNRIAAETQAAVTQLREEILARDRLEKDRAVEELREELKLAQAQAASLNHERDELRRQLDVQSRSAAEFQTVVKDLREDLAHQAADLHTLLQEVRLQEAERQDGGASAHRRAYRQMIGRLREWVRTAVPRGEIVAVVSKGDDALLHFPGRQGWHFPREEGGAYAGYYPANSQAAVAHLEVLRARGAQYLLLPSTAAWWLDSYPEFQAHLDARYRVVRREEGAGILYDLGYAATAAAEDGLASVVERFRAAAGRDPAVLDWNTRQPLAERFRDLAVFAPPPGNGKLPYLDHSVDVVAIASVAEPVIEEARRVAEVAVVNLAEGASRVLWLQEMPEPLLPTVSIVIAVCNQWRHTATCLKALRETLPPGFRGEIIVIDDASRDETPRQLASLAERDSRMRLLRSEQNRGFVDSGNCGAEAASGEFLIFLNNDTVPLPGWLAPLLATFQQFADAGAVGGKLLFPDGRLQEAGGIVFRDGSAANFGHGQADASKPPFNFVRAVDYCSGALLATPRGLFQELGGFDEEFRPGYYEDTDYCFRLRDRGYRVYYQPESVIVHVAGGTAGTDLSRGMKQHQVTNQRRFRERWRRGLEAHEERPVQLDEETWYRLAHCKRELTRS